MPKACSNPNCVEIKKTKINGPSILHFWMNLQKEDHWQNPENFFFQGRSFLEGKIQKIQKKIFKKIY